MTSLTPKDRKGYSYRVQLAANTPGHPKYEEAKARLAETSTPAQKVVAPEAVAEAKTFSIELAQQLIDSGNRFPVSFDLAWQWIGYTRKDNAKRALIEAGFIENEDILITEEATTTGISRKLNENIFLTIECFKMWGMMAKTAQGRNVREYFLECERIAKQKIAKQAITKPSPQPTAPPIPQLPGDIRLVQMVSTLKDLDFELLNPRFKQGLQDLAADMLGISQPRLEAERTADQEGVWCGCVERAEQLGFPVGLLIEKRTSLGRWVASRITDSVKETRLCNGTQRPINVYRVTDELDRVIISYFDKLNISL